MKKTILYSGLILSALLCGCAKDPSTGLNDSAKLAFDAWMQVNHPEGVKTELGAYVLSETPGAGALVGNADTSPYLWVEYSSRYLNGTVYETTDEALAKQVGTYAEKNYYGPVVWARANNGITAGLDEAVNTMRVGGSKSLIIPGWLQTFDRYDTAEEYLKKVSGTSAQYELKIVDIIPDINKWETDSIGRYISHHFPGKSVLDSLQYGFYYFRTREPSSDKEFPDDTTIYINYVGRLLNGTVFDTNVKDSAKYYGLYSASSTYSPSQVDWFSTSNQESFKDITMGGSSLIEGFSYALSQMHPHEAGTAIFYSSGGYSAKGSGSAIPGYSPLRFDIEIVDKP